MDWRLLQIWLEFQADRDLQGARGIYLRALGGFTLVRARSDLQLLTNR